MEHRPILSTYCTHQGLGIMTVQDLLRLDILFYAFGDVDGGRLSFAHGEDLALLPLLRRTNPELRLMLSLGGGGKSGFSTSTQTPAMRRALARTIAQTVHERGFDGVDIDWEFPTVNGVREERAWHAELLCLLREELDRIAGGRRYLLSIAAPSGEWCFKTIDLAAIAPVLDYVCLMTYDMAGGGHLTCHHTAARSAPVPAMAEASVQANLEIFTAHGIPAEKILLGAAFYSRLWRDVRPSADGGYPGGLFVETDGPSDYGPGYDELLRSYIGKNGFIRYWDDAAKAPYLFDGGTFISYDDPQSLREKCRLVRQAGAAGMMAWEYGYDSSHTLLPAMERYLRADAAERE